MRDDDGHLVVTMVHETLPRTEVVKLALEMQKVCIYIYVCVRIHIYIFVCVCVCV